MRYSDCLSVFRVTGREEVAIYLLIVPLGLVKTLPCLQAPYFPMPVQELTLNVFHHQMCSAWVIFYLPPPHKAMLSLSPYHGSLEPANIETI